MRKKSQILDIIEWILIVGAAFLVARLLDLSLIIPIVLLAFFSFLTFYFKKNKLISLHLGLLLVIVIVAAKAIVDYSTISYYYIPLAAICMLTVILFEDLVLGFAIAAITSMIAGNIGGNSLSLSLIFFVGSIIGMLSVWRARRRSQIILAGLYVGIVQLFCFLLISTQQHPFSIDAIRIIAGPVIISGVFASFIVIGTLPMFEYLFKVVTNISLLELSDFNHPLLRKMILEAPGTYQHSLIVGNLAEAATEAIGANSLLARVGAYYHDIGKIEKAEYFSENQIHLRSKHDKLQPNMSRLIIINHIKEGEELAKKYKLNPMIIDFVTQHHGTSMMYYFYRRAMKDIEEDQEVKEEGFRYPGPKPQRKEIAIVLLSDAVEAASRTLSEPTPERIEELVRKIINNKFIDGQLDECDLTLRDLEIIGSVFLRILSAIYHSRVKYPDEKDEADNIQSSKKNSHSERSNNTESKTDSSSAE
ncbi:MAG: HDIG domain-containing metalloprotein [Candidatus Omnitrophota bacterium]